MAKVFRIFLYSMILIALALPSVAQRPNMDKPIYIVNSNIIAKGMEEQYLQSRIALIAKLTEAGFPHPFLFWKSNDNIYQAWFSASEMTEARALSQSWEPLKQDSAIINPMLEEIESTYTSVMQIKRDLTYIPKQQRLKEEQIQFCRLTRFHLKEGSKSQVEDLIKQMITLFEEKEMSVSLYFGGGVYGYEPDLLFQWAFTRDEEDYLQISAKVILELGEEYYNLREQILSHVIKTQHTDFHLVEGLSYEPR